MTKKKPLETSEEFVNALTDLFNEIGPETPEEVEAILREAGYDPAKLAAEMQAFAEQSLKNSPLNWRNRAQQELTAARSHFESTLSRVSRSRSELIEAIQQLLQQVGGQPQQALAHFRNFESASDDDLASMLEELEYLKSQQQGQDKGGA